MSELEKRMEKEIEKRRFNLLEIMGFRKNPRLALLAGCSIGYIMALKDSPQLPNKTRKDRCVMLVLSRRISESIQIGPDVEVKILDVRGRTVRVGIAAPKETTVFRTEIMEQATKKGSQ